MSVKDFIKCLTLLLWLMPSQDVNACVKDILNNDNQLFTTTNSHENGLVAVVNQFSFEEYKDDGKDIVVVDAGHGGHDPGACGKKSKEKDIALDIALKIGKQLKANNPGIQVIYTRDKDVFIPLHKRIAIANDNKADLFISIHCNYVNNPKVCGTETFVMGLHRAEENLEVAKRENSAVLLESEYETNYEGYDPNSPIGHILLSMFQNLHLDQSIEVASKVENYFGKRKKTKSRGVKQAGFVVLRQATMPSVLIETGFLSNPKEEKYLLSAAGQKEMAGSISKGIVSYFDDKKILREELKDVNIAKKKDVEQNFVVQIGVFSKPIEIQLSGNLKSKCKIIEDRINGLYKYAIGYFATKEEAIDSCAILKKNGYPDAFVRANVPSVSE